MAVEVSLAGVGKEQFDLAEGKLHVPTVQASFGISDGLGFSLLMDGKVISWDRTTGFTHKQLSDNMRLDVDLSPGAVAGPRVATGRTAGALQKDEELTAFIEALRNAKAKDLGGGMSLLSFGSRALLRDSPLGKAHTFIVRDFFPKLFERLKGQHKSLLTGVSGTGKSWFIWYVVRELLHQEEPPAIVWHSNQTSGSGQELVLFKNGEAYVGSYADIRFTKVLKLESTWFFGDGFTPPTMMKARAVMVCSPKRSVYKDWIKDLEVSHLIMPLWLWPEIETCWQERYSSNLKLPLTRVRRCFDYYGGVPRLVLQSPSLYDDVNKDEVPLRNALNTTSIEQVEAAVSGAYDAGPMASHRIVHQDGDRLTFEPMEYQFATAYVGREFCKTADTRGLAARLMSSFLNVSGSSTSMHGIVFELIAHKACLKGGKFDYRILDVPGSEGRSAKRGRPSRKDKKAKDAAVADAIAAASGEPLQMDVPPFEHEVCFDSMGTVSNIGSGFRHAVQANSAPAYLRPSGSRHPCMDACVLPDRLLQMTVSPNHAAVDEDALERHLQCLAELPKYYHDYLVPDKVFASFKVPNLKRAPGSRTARTVQRVVKVIIAMTTPVTPLRISAPRLGLVRWTSSPTGSRIRQLDRAL